MLSTLFERIPSVWIALALGGFSAWAYFKYTKRNSLLTKISSESISSIIIIYILFSKFVSGLLFYPSFRIKDDIFSIISGSPENGWFVGVVAVLLYMLLVLHKKNAFNQNALSLVVGGTISGSILFFGYLALNELYTFRLQDIVRFSGAIILLLTILFLRDGIQSYPQRFGVAFTLLLFITSGLVPRTSVLFGFSLAQWLYIAVMIAFLIVEAIGDIRTARNSSHTKSL